MQFFVRCFQFLSLRLVLFDGRLLLLFCYLQFLFEKCDYTLGSAGPRPAALSKGESLDFIKENEKVTALNPWSFCRAQDGRSC